MWLPAVCGPCFLYHLLLLLLLLIVLLFILAYPLLLLLLLLLPLMMRFEVGLEPQQERGAYPRQSDSLMRPLRPLLTHIHPHLLYNETKTKTKTKTKV